MSNLSAPIPWLAALLLGVAACTPKIQVEAPVEPITINLNIRHEVIIRVERDVDDLFAENEDIFGEGE
ncbi:MAG: YnbE family lipoprotein [Proteobacteria bacterium]|nr:YnbE family lipoprotein [Pseudomonadota bacterium]